MQQNQIKPHERRAHARLALDHEGTLTIRGSRGRTCRLRDFCPGGLHLQIPRPAWDGRGTQAPALAARGDSAVVRFAAGSGADQQEFEVRLRVARVFEGGMGVAFVDPHPGALRALHRLAAHGHEHEHGATHSRATMESIRSSLRTAFAEYIEPNLAALMRNVRSPLVQAASAAGSNQAQSRYFEAIPVLESSRGAITREVFGNVLERIGEFGDADAPSRTSAAEALSDGEISLELALVNVDEFEDFLVVAELVSAAESRFDGPLKELQQRLGTACGKPLAADGNPVAPATLCHAFRDAIKGFQLHRDARLVLYRELDQQVVPALGGMYGEINQELERLGVLPPPKAPRKKSKPKNPAPEPTTAEATDAAPPADTAAALDTADTTRAPATPEPVRVGWDTGANAPGAGSDNPVIGNMPASEAAGAAAANMTLAMAASGDADSLAAVGGAGHVAPVVGGMVGSAASPGDPGAASAPAGAAVAWPTGGNSLDYAKHGAAGSTTTASGNGQARTAFGTARALLGLQRQSAAAATPAAGTTDASGEALATFSSDEVLAALGSLQQEHFSSVSGGGGNGVLPALRGVLATVHADGAQRALAPSEADPLDLMERLFRAMCSDRLLGTATVERIARLQPAVHKANLLEPGFFDDVEHPARRLLDALGRLDAAVEESDELHALIDDILARAVQGFDRDLAPVGEAADSLEDLSAQSEAEYQRNVAEVVQAREAQEAFLRSRRKSAADAGRSDTGRDTQALEWSVWLNRVRRLRVGDGLLMSDQSARARRLTVAWIGNDHEMLVLVDWRGHKADSPILQELAMRLRRGTAVMLPRTQHPLVARALRAALAEMHDGIEHSATHDRVTGLVNRKQFEGEMGGALTRAVQEHMQHVLLHLALDHHALLLEQAGAAAAESLLRIAAQTVLDAQGGSGRVASMGSGSLGVLLEDCTADAGHKVAERLRGKLAAQAIDHEGIAWSAAASVGVALITKRSADVDSVLAAAERAAEEARADGGDRVTDAHGTGEKQRGGGPMMEWVPLLNRILRADEPCFRWQRITPLREDMDPAPFYEILLGPRDDNGKPVSPENLLQAAVYYHHMQDLDRWVVRNTLAWMAANPERLADVGACAINLADATLADEHLVEFVAEELLASGVPPGKVCFEVSEAAVLANLAAVEDLMFTLREYGCRFTLVDVGGGGSAYEHLERLPVDYVKIGGIFVRDIASSADDLAVVQSIHEIGRFLGKQTIAECVEDEETLRVLREVGVDYAQGFGIERPRYLDDDTPFPVAIDLADTLAAGP